MYIENQFFITRYTSPLWNRVPRLTVSGSTVVNDVKIENRIGDALVHRIIRAHREGTAWKCCIVVPLLPGFTFPVDHGDASAVNFLILIIVTTKLIWFCLASHHIGVPESYHRAWSQFYIF